MPTPKKNENKDEFIERCIPIVIDEEGISGNDQAYAYCLDIWEDYNMSDDMYELYKNLEKIIKKWQ